MIDAAEGNTTEISGLTGNLIPSIGSETTEKPATTSVPKSEQTCEKSCSAIEKCLDDAQTYCDEYCFQFLPPDVQQCSKSFEKHNYWDEAREAAETCASYYGVDFKCHNTTTSSVRRRRYSGKPQPQHGKPQNHPSKSQSFGSPPGGPGARGPPSGGPGAFGFPQGGPGGPPRGGAGGPPPGGAGAFGPPPGGPGGPPPGGPEGPPPPGGPGTKFSVFI